MASPFTNLDNATIIFQISTAVATTTDDWGNVVDAQGNLTVKAFLKIPNITAASKMPRPNVPGLSQDAIYFEGYAVNPMTLPATVKQGSWGTATIGGMTGKFYLEQFVNPPYGKGGIGLIVQNAAGTRIEGWLQRDSY